MDPRERAIRDALALLGKRRVLLAIHDASFPSAVGEDVGRGSPYSRGGADLARLARRLGFDGLQLGPQGQTSEHNQSPYDGTLFSRNVLSLDFHELLGHPEWGELVDRAALDAAVRDNPEASGRHVAYAHAWERQHALARELHGRFRRARAAGEGTALAIDARLSRFRRAHERWIEGDALYDALLAEHDGARWRTWPELDRWLWSPPAWKHKRAEARRLELLSRHAGAVERWALAQLAAAEQHARWRDRMRADGLQAFGDVQVGLSPSDAWRRQAILLRSHRLGAPPSRTNPEGQPWGHSVLDPEQYRGPEGGPGPVVAFVVERMGKMLAEFDGLRIDHPHGFVCPWVYRADDPDPIHAVQHGARLFSSPDLLDHPELARFAIARPDQLDRDAPRHADGWVRELDDAQVDRYALLVDAIVECAEREGRDERDVVCEVLSTQPHPLARVMQRYGLGRFRVTQKANLDDPDDVYRSENARPEDWIMVGNHDTPPIWALAERWQGTAEGRAQAEYLAHRLAPDGGAEALREELARSPGALVEAKLADAFASRADNVMVFFADLLGLDEVYNRPGTVNEDNWTLRVPPDFAERYEERAARREAVDPGRVLAHALRARGEGFARPHAELMARLESG